MAKISEPLKYPEKARKEAETGTRKHFPENNSPEDGKILKPVQPPPRGQREVDFYTEIFSKKADKTDKRIRKHLPNFFGTKLISGTKYLVLEDVTTGYRLPNVLGWFICDSFPFFFILALGALEPPLIATKWG